MRSHRGFEFLPKRLRHGGRLKCSVAGGAAYGFDLTRRHPAALAPKLDLICYRSVTHVHHPEYEIQLILKVNRRDVVASH